MILSICETSSILHIIYYVKIAMLVIRIAVPIILIVTLMLDLTKAVANGKSDLIEQVKKSAVTKFIAAILVFLMPTILNAVLKLTSIGDEYLTCYDNANMTYINLKAEEELILKELNVERMNELNQERSEAYEKAHPIDSNTRPDWYSGNGGTSYSSLREKIVQIALNEVGTCGYNNKYNSWYYGRTSNAAWCAAFVSWVGNEAGISGTGIPKAAYVPTVKSFFKSKGKYENSDYTPSPGDIVVINWHSSSCNKECHVGIVEYVDTDGIHTIEGNTGTTGCTNNGVAQKVRQKSIIDGYGVIE